MNQTQIIFDKKNHTYFVNGQLKPGVTTILECAGLSPDFNMVSPEILARKAQIGTEVHRVIELLLKNDLGEYDPVLEPYVQAAKTFLKTFNIRPLGVELPVYSSSLDCCGTLDLLARYNDTEEGLFDFKTSSTIELGYVGPQTAGYDLLYREWSGQGRKQPYNRFAVQLLKTGKFKLIPCNNQNDVNIFMYAVLSQRQDENYEFYMLQIKRWKERFKNVS